MAKKKVKKEPAYNIGPAFPEYQVREFSDSPAHNLVVFSDRSGGVTLEKKFKYHTIWNDDPFTCEMGEEETKNLIAALEAALADCAKRKANE